MKNAIITGFLKTILAMANIAKVQQDEWRLSIKAIVDESGNTNDPDSLDDLFYSHRFTELMDEFKKHLSSPPLLTKDIINTYQTNFYSKFPEKFHPLIFHETSKIINKEFSLKLDLEFFDGKPWPESLKDIFVGGSFDECINVLKMDGDKLDPILSADGIYLKGTKETIAFAAWIAIIYKNGLAVELKTQKLANLLMDAFPRLSINEKTLRTRTGYNYDDYFKKFVKHL